MKKTALISSVLILIISLSGCINSETKETISTEPTNDQPVEITETIDEFENWETYENEKFNYKIKFPQNSKINIHQETSYLEIDNPTEEYYGQWSIAVFQNSEDQSIDEYVDEKYNPEDCVTSRNATELHGEPGVEIAYTCTVSGSEHIVVAEKEDYFYLISSGDVANLEIYEKILTTFEFTKQAEVVMVKPEITSPKNGSTVEGPVVTISGKATPGHDVIAYNNPTEEVMECVNTYGLYAHGTADSDGNFEFDLAGVCKKNMEVFVSTVNLEKNKAEDCIAKDNISESINFEVSGELHETCFM